MALPDSMRRPHHLPIVDKESYIHPSFHGESIERIVTAKQRAVHIITNSSSYQRAMKTIQHSPTYSSIAGSEMTTTPINNTIVMYQTGMYSSATLDDNLTVYSLLMNEPLWNELKPSIPCFISIERASGQATVVLHLTQ